MNRSYTNPDNAVNDEHGSPKARPLTLDASAESVNPNLPAFLARPESAPVYHGFPIVEGVEVEGFRLGMITDFEASPEDGDAYVIAPDGSRAGLVWCVGDTAGLEEVCPLEISRWGVWAVTFPEAMKTKDAMQRNLATVLPTAQGEMAPLEGAIRITCHRPQGPFRDHGCAVAGMPTVGGAEQHAMTTSEPQPAAPRPKRRG